jgi:tripartite motif-containing protein 59
MDFVTMRDKVKENLVCPICLDIVKDPVSLPCSHTFCRSCLQKGLEKDNNLIICPYCRKEHRFEGGLNAIPVNVVLSSLLESLATQEKIERCPDHQKKLSICCITCGKCLCTHCTLFTHARDHTFKSIKEYFEIVQKKKEEKVEWLKSKKRKYTDRLDYLDEKLRQVFCTI